MPVFSVLKVTMRVIQNAVNEVKAIQPSAAQDLLAVLPPGSPHTLLQTEPEAGGPGQAQGQGVGSLLQGQERLHQEGKAALQTLSCTREALREAMERELQEQREHRAHSRAFFRSVTRPHFYQTSVAAHPSTIYLLLFCPSCLCSSQLSLCEEDRLRMKLEFLKCLSVMDRCLVLPHAVSRKKLHTTLAAERTENVEQMVNHTTSCSNAITSGLLPSVASAYRLLPSLNSSSITFVVLQFLCTVAF